MYTYNHVYIYTYVIHTVDFPIPTSIFTVCIYQKSHGEEIIDEKQVLDPLDMIMILLTNMCIVVYIISHHPDINQ